ncbi:hypothetical protein DFJ73DRAFT_769895 [Zopfochytrium polystomum]|nr:hypothetical protein DFJ73DRAFT_769895 [Zopfochytrium polystomum]
MRRGEIKGGGRLQRVVEGISENAQRDSWLTFGPLKAFPTEHTPKNPPQVTLARTQHTHFLFFFFLGNTATPDRCYSATTEALMIVFCLSVGHRQRKKLPVLASVNRPTLTRRDPQPQWMDVENSTVEFVHGGAESGQPPQAPFPGAEVLAPGVRAVFSLACTLARYTGARERQDDKTVNDIWRHTKQHIGKNLHTQILFN